MSKTLKKALKSLFHRINYCWRRNLKVFLKTFAGAAYESVKACCAIHLNLKKWVIKYGF